MSVVISFGRYFFLYIVIHVVRPFVCSLVFVLCMCLFIVVCTSLIIFRYLV